MIIEKMKKISMLGMLLLLFVAMPISAKKKVNKEYDQTELKISNKPTPPTYSQFQPVGDSILAEGLRLYAHEKMAWLSYDLMVEHCKNCPIDGIWAIWGESTDMRCVCVDKNSQKVYFSCRCDQFLNMKERIVWNDSIRNITPEEKKAVEIRSKALSAVEAQCRDSLSNALSAQGSLNFDVIPENDGTYKVYVLQGTSLNGIIPMGNDYLIRFDKDMKMTSFERCHKTYFPIQALKSDMQFHSHTPDNPHITATDICNCLLYGKDLYGIKNFAVLSTHYSEPFYIFFDTEKLSVIGMPKEFMEKIYKK